MSHHEIFTARGQPELHAKTFLPSEEDLAFAKRSLEEKRKVSFGNQQILFCRREEAELLTANEKVIEGARKKYVDFIKKNYNQKLSEELFNLTLLKNKIKEFENRRRDDAAKDDEDTIGKKTAAAAKKRVREPKPAAGRKKVKGEEGEQKGGKEKQAKGKKVAKKEAEAVPELKELQAEQLEAPSSEESVSLNLINSLSQEDFEGDYE